LCCGVGAGAGGADEDAEGLEEAVGEAGLGGVPGDGGEQGGQRVAEGERHAHQRLDRVLVLGARGLEKAGGGGRDT